MENVDNCLAHYSMRLSTGKLVIKSPEKGQKLIFKDQVKGLQEILPLMKDGDKWDIHIPYRNAYGEKGQIPYIPPFATLIFELEVTLL